MNDTTAASKDNTKSGHYTYTHRFQLRSTDSMKAGSTIITLKCPKLLNVWPPNAPFPVGWREKFCLYCLNNAIFGQLILGKIVATRCQIYSKNA